MRRATVAWAVVAMMAITGGVLIARPARDAAGCGTGFVATEGRCMPEPACGPPLARDGARCVAPEVRVPIPATHVLLGPSDWEAEGKVVSRTVVAGPFEIDAFEVTQERFSGGASPDPLRAASGMTRKEAAQYCASHDGRLPTEDEWIVAAAGAAGTRYPWGETGAVCRRAAFGLARGPCASRGSGPDTVGAHGTGDTPLGVHDLAGNVAEWVATDAPGSGRGIAKGGSWRSELATELRVWARIEVDPEGRDDRVGFRCVHDAH
jgi:formylglycine-generating enzyme